MKSRHRLFTALVAAALVLVPGPAFAADDMAAPSGAPHRNPNLVPPNAGLTAGPLPDLKVQLVSGWWVGNERHSRFKLSNIGTLAAKDVSVRTWIDTSKPSNGNDDQTIAYVHFGDMPAGTFQFIDVVCKPKALWQCDNNGAKALSISSDANAANDWAEDEV
ncbi:MAG: hypothetical protein U0821_24230 [Chloroflexota bacterium]